MFTENHKLAELTLTRLKASYAADWSLVGHPDNIANLPVLRALERADLIKIEVVVMNKSWVVTAAGAIWLALVKAGPEKRLSLDRDILCTPIGYWMRRSDAVDGMLSLDRAGLCDVTDVNGQRPEYLSITPVFLGLEYGDPLHDLARYLPEKETA